MARQIKAEIPDRNILEGKASEEYLSSDIHMIQALLSLKHQPVRIYGEGGTLFFVFDRNEIQENLRKLVANADLQVALKDVWAASRVWSMVMYEYRNG